MVEADGHGGLVVAVAVEVVVVGMEKMSTTTTTTARRAIVRTTTRANIDLGIVIMVICVDWLSILQTWSPAAPFPAQGGKREQREKAMTQFYPLYKKMAHMKKISPVSPL